MGLPAKERNKARLLIEQLEARDVPSTITWNVLDGRVLEVIGTSRSERIIVDIASNGSATVNGERVNGTVDRVVIYGNGGHDWFTVHDERVKGVYSGFASQDIPVDPNVTVDWLKANGGQSVVTNTVLSWPSLEPVYRWAVYVNSESFRKAFPNETSRHTPRPNINEYNVVIFHEPGIPMTRNLWVAQVGDTTGELSGRKYEYGIDDPLMDQDSKRSLADLRRFIESDQQSANANNNARTNQDANSNVSVQSNSNGKKKANPSSNGKKNSGKATAANKSVTDAVFSNYPSRTRRLAF